jgi:hypothetical protein
VLSWCAGTSAGLGGPAVTSVTDLGLGDVVVRRYERGFDLALVWLVALWYAANLVTLLPAAPAYRSVGLEILAWLALAAVGAAAATRLLRHRADRRTSWLLAAAALAGSALATAATPGAAAFTRGWAWDATGWVALVTLLRRPVTELAVVLAANSGFTLAVLLRDGLTDRLDLARFAAVGYATSALQLTVAVAAHALGRTAARAARTAADQADAVRERAVTERLHASRQDRYQLVRASVAPLLAGLSSGELDPGQRGVQQRCAVAASRLRRLFAESDDVPDPLVHELRACADIADRRGVLIDLQVLGAVPALDRAIRRVLLDAPLRALAEARRQARITVVGREGEVAVSVFADRPEQAPPESPRARGVAGGGGPGGDGDPTGTAESVSVRIQKGDDQQWVEARWRRG